MPLEIARERPQVFRTSLAIRPDAHLDDLTLKLDPEADAHRRGVEHRSLAMVDTRIRRHRRLQGDANPYDPQWSSYFDARFQRWILDHRRSALRILWRRQSGHCACCHH
jgi:hypothetical protein